MTNIYDFDKTIYQGDSTIDFYFFALKKQKKIIKKLPHQIKGYILYIFKRITKKELKEYFYSFLPELNNIELLVDEFWVDKKYKIQKWYLDKKDRNDIIITASPEFLILPIGKILGVQKVIASIVDSHTGKYSGENCKGKEKVRRLLDVIPNISIDEFYSDSKSDIPLAKLARNSFIVKGKKIQKWNLESK